MNLLTDAYRIESYLIEANRINNSKSEQDGLDPNLIAICLIEEWVLPQIAAAYQLTMKYVFVQKVWKQQIKVGLKNVCNIFNRLI